jgi:hypothetical protein
MNFQDGVVWFCFPCKVEREKREHEVVRARQKWAEERQEERLRNK